MSCFTAVGLVGLAATLTALGLRAAFRAGARRVGQRLLLGMGLASFSAGLLLAGLAARLAFLGR